MNFLDEIDPGLDQSSDPFITVLTGSEVMEDHNNMAMGPGGNGPNNGYQQQSSENWGNSPMMDEGFNGRDRAFMWQQTNYMPDASSSSRVSESGFISGSTTQPPSMSGHDEDIEGNFVGGPGSITGSYNLDSLPQSETSSLHSSQSVPSDPEVFIPNLIERLEDPDQVVSDTTLISMEKFSRSDKFLQAIIQSERLTVSLVNILNNASQAIGNPELESNKEEFKLVQERAKSASNIMRNMSNTIQGKHVIIISNAIPALTSFLGCKVDRVLNIAISTVHNLLLVKDEKNADEVNIRERAKAAIREAKGSRDLAMLMGRKEEKLRTIVNDCLRILSVSHNETKQIILEHKGPQILVEIMRTQNYKNLLMTTSRLLKVLSVCPKNKPAILQAGGMDAMARGLTHESHQIKSHCIWTLRNLSDVAKKNINDLDMLVQNLVDLLDHPDKNISICSACILFNLTCNNAPVKLAVCKANGIPALVNVIRTKGAIKELLEPSAGALRHITNGYEESDLAQKVLIHDWKALPVIMEQLELYMKRDPPHWPVIKAVLGLLRNVVHKPNNQIVLREQGCVKLSIELLKYVSEKYVFTRSPPVENVRPEEIVDLTLACVFLMSKDPNNHRLFQDRDCLAILNKLATNEFFQKTAVGTLSELATDTTLAIALLQMGVSENIQPLLHSKNEKTASYSASIMQSLTQTRKENPEAQQIPFQFQQQQQMMMNQPPQQSQDFFNRPQTQMQQQQQLYQQQQPPPQQQQQQMQQQNVQRRMPGPPQDYDSMMSPQSYQQVPFNQQQQQQTQQGLPPQGMQMQQQQHFMDQSVDYLDMCEVMSPDFQPSPGGGPGGGFGGAGNQFYGDNMS